MATAMAAPPRRTWIEHVRGIDATPKQIAAAVGVSQSIVSRWLKGEVHPSAENVVAFARAFRDQTGDKPVELLMVAGYLEPDEVEGAYEVLPSARALSNADLLAELADRIASRDINDTGNSLSSPDE
jgi:transcriptional regulator with XRE-family HTH domain